MLWYITRFARLNCKLFWIEAMRLSFSQGLHSFNRSSFLCGRWSNARNGLRGRQVRVFCGISLVVASGTFWSELKWEPLAHNPRAEKWLAELGRSG
jgi:hypothetical protein